MNVQARKQQRRFTEDAPNKRISMKPPRSVVSVNCPRRRIDLESPKVNRGSDKLILTYFWAYTIYDYVGNSGKE